MRFKRVTAISVTAAALAVSASPAFAADPPTFTGPPGGPDSQASQQGEQKGSAGQQDKTVTHCPVLTGSRSVVVEGTGSGTNQGGGDCIV